MNRKENTQDSKISIISDIKSKTQSILPFGLQMAKYLHAEVDIIHIVDVRSHQGVPSRYSDSQSLTPGPKLTFDKIVEREIQEANNMLEKVLSREASRLNYPLKINKVVKEGRIIEEVKESVESASQSIVLISEKADGYIFHSRNEIIELMESIDAMSLLVPPKINFQVFKEITLITDFSNKFGLSSFTQTSSLLHKLNPRITAVDVASPRRYLEKQVKGNQWSQVFKSKIYQNIKTLVLKGKSHSDTLSAYIRKTKPDLIIYSYRKPGFINNLFHNSFLERCLEEEKYPVIYAP